jgi:hypothetical protein
VHPETQTIVPSSARTDEPLVFIVKVQVECQLLGGEELDGHLFKIFSSVLPRSSFTYRKECT